jgi:hypothetical protein
MIGKESNALAIQQRHVFIRPLIPKDNGFRRRSQGTMSEYKDCGYEHRRPYAPAIFISVRHYLTLIWITPPGSHPKS